MIKLLWKNKKMKTSERKWVLEDHVCQDCGGRILRCVAGGGATGGGNPIYKCADCGKTASSSSPDALCWCGFHHKGQHLSTYRCLPFSILKEHPELEQSFAKCGCLPGRTEVGVILESELRK